MFRSPNFETDWIAFRPNQPRNMRDLRLLPHPGKMQDQKGELSKVHIRRSLLTHVLAPRL